MNLVKISLCLYQYILCVGAPLLLLLGNDHILVDLSVVYKHTVLLQSINQLQFILRIPVYPVWYGCCCSPPPPPPPGQ
jgi:hypothetical protein